MYDKKYFPIKYNSDYYDVMANKIIKGKQQMSLQEAKLIRLLITQVVKEDKDFRTYITTIKDLAKFMGISDANLYRDIKNICDSLMTKIIKIQTNNLSQPWETIHWLSVAKYNGNGILTLKLSEEIQPYLISLNGWFTKYKLKNILTLSSFYAIRIYELIKLNIGINKTDKNFYTFIFTIQYLRQFLCCEEKFKQIGQFKEKVLNISIREINLNTNCNISYEDIKTGRTITSIQFFVQEKQVIKPIEDKKHIVENKVISEVLPDTKEQPIIEVEPPEIKFDEVDVAEVNIDDLIDDLRDFIKEPLKTKELKEILKISSNNIELIMHKYAIYRLHDDIKNLAEWLIWAIETDHQEPVKDIDDLCDELRTIISEPLITKDLKALLSVSNNNIKLIKDKYQVAKKQGGINNLTAFLIAAIKNDFNIPISLKANPVVKKNGFINYQQRDDWDFEKLAIMDEQFMIDNLERD